MLFRKMEVARDFEYDRCLPCQHSSAANILLRDASVIQAVKHPKHSQDFAVAA